MNKRITISTGNSRYAQHWRKEELYWLSFCKKFDTPIRTAESFEQYQGLSKKQKANLKDVGGFLGGTLNGHQREAKNVISRDLVTLDFDQIPSESFEDLLNTIKGLGVAFLYYTTRSHSKSRPKLRVVIPTDRSMTPDEYEPIARKVAEVIGIDYVDPTCFRVHQLMYFPSTSKDGLYQVKYKDDAYLSVDGALALYTDWKDVSSWPKCITEETLRKRQEKAQDPREKKGIIGTFCNVYSIDEAIERFLPGEWIKEREGIYTYAKGSTVGGGHVYDDVFFYSYHATSPSSGQLCNAFDLVRLHKFLDLDAKALPNTPVNRMPSFLAMVELANQDERVAESLKKEAYEKLNSKINDTTEAEESPKDWLKLLDLESVKTGKLARSLKNVVTILRYDERLKNKIRYEGFSERNLVFGKLPWREQDDDTTVRDWQDTDEDRLLLYLQEVYEFQPKKGDVNSAVVCITQENAFNELHDYLNSLKWDGVKRLDTLFIDYFGADDTEYTRAVTRKVLVAAVTRAFNNGAKFDEMLVLKGKQGTGKSTFLAKIGGKWFSDSLDTFKGKEAYESLQSAWIIEIAELASVKRSDVEDVKKFLSKREDIYRRAYGRNKTYQKRKCVFIGTTNENTFLSDVTGNRRFWVVALHEDKAKKSPFTDFTQYEVDQVLAEAMEGFKNKEPLHLPKALKDEAERLIQENYIERDELEGVIQAFLERQIPVDWYKQDLDYRLSFLNGLMSYNGELMDRPKICPLELWVECFGNKASTLDRKQSKRFNQILERLDGWEKQPSTGRYGSEYGRQKGYQKRQL